MNQDGGDVGSALHSSERTKRWSILAHTRIALFAAFIDKARAATRQLALQGRRHTVPPYRNNMKYQVWLPHEARDYRIDEVV